MRCVLMYVVNNDVSLRPLQKVTVAVPAATTVVSAPKLSVEDQVFSAVESGLQQLIDVASDAVRKEFEASIKYAPAMLSFVGLCKQVIGCSVTMELCSAAERWKLALWITCAS